ncbi:MAG: N-formylglutamate amidohydrolase [Shinella sp.]|nr:N-formylglutamate amidohydrolase [Shinella sp.]
MLQTADPDVRLLRAADPVPVECFNMDGASPFFLTCEHAGRAIPTALGSLGIEAREMDRHIAYDVGAEGLSHALSALLDAPLVLQRYSRLVIDCNRPFEAADCVVTRSDGTDVPANADLDDRDRRRRYVEIHQPLHETIATALDHRHAAGKPTILVAVHSFTPVMRATGAVRDFELGLLCNRDRHFAEMMLAAFRARNPQISATINEPYIVDDLSDYTIPVHGERRGLPHVLLEVRSDQIEDTEGQQRWAGLLARSMRDAAEKLKETPDGR